MGGDPCTTSAGLCRTLIVGGSRSFLRKVQLELRIGSSRLPAPTPLEFGGRRAPAAIWRLWPVSPPCVLLVERYVGVVASRRMAPAADEIIDAKFDALTLQHMIIVKGS